MKAPFGIIVISQIVTVAALAATGTYAFAGSCIYAGIRSSAEATTIPVSYIPWLLCGLLCLYGVFAIVMKGKSSGVLMFVILLLSLPSILSHNILDWPAILGTEFILSTSLGFYEVLALGVCIITGYVLLHWMRRFRQTYRSLIAGGADLAEVRGVAFSNYRISIVTLSVALVVAGAIAFLARSLELLTIEGIRNMPSNVFVIGIGCILLLSGYLYWLGVHRRAKG